MNRKKLLRSGLAILCIISMVIGYFGGLSPESKVEAAETIETLPDFDEVTPKDFGIEDFSETEITEKTSTEEPVTSVNQKTLSANIVFGAGATINYCEPWATGYTGGLKLWLRDNGRSMRFYNYAGDKLYYIGGEFVQDGETVIYQGGTKSSDRFNDFTVSDSLFTGTETLNTKEVLFSLSTELVDFDLDGNTDDLKVGIWFNGMLQDNCYIYVLNSTVVNKPYLNMKVKSCTSPLFVTTTSQWDDYKVVTPATFGIADQQSATDGGIDVSTPASDVIPYEVDKTIFKAKLRNATKDSTTGTNGASEITYLGGNIEINVSPKASTSLLIYNKKATGNNTLYAGYDKMGEGIDNRESYTPIAKGSYKGYLGATSSYGKFAFNTGKEYMLSAITEFVDFDNDTYMDDLQIQISISANGTDYVPEYFYYVDYEETTFQGTMTTSNMKAIFSPNVELDDLGLIGGEYAGNNTDFTPSTVATSKVMNGATVQSDVLFKGAGGTLSYGWVGDADEKAIQFTSTEDGIQVSHTYGAESQDIVLLNKKMVGIDVINNAFNLKLTTDVVANDSDGVVNDIKLGIQVNSKYSCFYLKDIASTDITGAKMSIYCEDGASIAFGRFENATPVDVAHCLDDGAYTFESASGVSRVSVDGVGKDASFALEQPGEYQLAVTKNRAVTWETVTIYHRYDVNDSDVFDVIDLIRMKKIQDKDMQAQTIENLTKVGKLAIWYDEESWSDVKTEAVLDLMRNRLVETTDSREAKITAIDEAQLAQFAHQSGAFTGNFTIMVDLAEAIDADLIDIYNENIILTSKAKFVSLNGEYPTINYRLVSKGGVIFYLTMPYMIGAENELTTREWRVPMPPSDYYTTLQIKFEIPEGVALYIDELSYREETEADLVAIDEEYNSENGVKFHAHSGFYKYAPANTAASFEMAGKVGFKSLITIPKFTAPTEKDPLGVGVCFHDDATVRHILRYKDAYKVNGSDIIQTDSEDDKSIDQFTYEDLTTRFHAGLGKSFYKNEPIPTLEEFFDICDEYKMAPVFSVHPALSPEQWNYVKRLLLNPDKNYTPGTQEVELDGVMVQSTWIYDHFQVKFGALRAENAEGYGLEDAVDAFGTTIGGYILIRSASSSTDLYTIAQGAGLVDETTGLPLDMVSVEFFQVAKDLEGKIALAQERGFKTISVAPNSGFSGQEFRRLMALGVNSFTVDYHCSMGLNW